MPLATAIFACLSPAHAETPASATLEEVIVTAQKRTESLQNVPVSITALGTQSSKSCTWRASTTTSSTSPSLLSVYRPRFRENLHAGSVERRRRQPFRFVAERRRLLDEQPITTIQGPLDIHVYDIARVEALAGPQGTLSARVPKREPSASSPISLNSTNFCRLRPASNTVKTAIPLQRRGICQSTPGLFRGDSLGRLVRKEGGYIDNVPGSLTYPDYVGAGPGSGFGFTNDNRTAPATPAVDTRYYGTAKKAYNDVETYGGRAALRVALNDNWTGTLVLQGQETKANGIFAVEETRHPEGYTNLYPYLGDLQVQHYNPENSLDHWGQASLTIEGKISNFDLTYAGGFIRRNDVTHSDYTDYAVGYAIYYQQPRGYFYDNAGNAINPTQNIEGRDGYKMYSHELRLQTPQDLPVRATIGGFLSQQQHDIEQRYTIEGLADSLRVRYWPETWWLTKELRINRDSAVFGEATWDITSHWNLLGGLRWYQYKNSLQGWYGFNFYDVPNPAKLRTGCPTPDVRDPVGGECQNLYRVTDGSGTTPKVTLTYKFDDERLVYATYSEGFRPGGVNRVGAAATYAADKLKNYEIGWKTTWFDNRVRFNGAIFQEDWNDFQFAYLGPNSVTIIRNASKAQVRGIETSIDWAATEQLTFGGGFSLMDPKLKSNFCKYSDAAGGIQSNTCNEYDSTGAVVAVHPFGAPAVRNCRPRRSSRAT